MTLEARQGKWRPLYVRRLPGWRNGKLTKWLSTVNWRQDVQHKDTKHNGLICDTQNYDFWHNYSIECHYAECRCAECRYAEWLGTLNYVIINHQEIGRYSANLKLLTIILRWKLWYVFSSLKYTCLKSDFCHSVNEPWTAKRQPETLRYYLLKDTPKVAFTQSRIP